MNIKETIQSQYRAALAMLGDAIQKCPDDLWVDETYQHPFWHVAYHVLFYTHLYLHDSGEEFVPWAKHRDDLGSLDVQGAESYTRDEILAFLALCQAEVERRVPALDLEAASGFGWLPFTKLELQLYNIRHLQHHTGQLADRLRIRAGTGVGWVGTRPSAEGGP
jgi:uncharacterized damage-inducible protein DinB